MAHYTYLEKLDCLLLNTLRSVDYHDCRVGCHECTVGILGEVLMSRGIENVDAVAVIVEL